MALNTLLGFYKFFCRNCSNVKVGKLCSIRGKVPRPHLKPGFFSYYCVGSAKAALVSATNRYTPTPPVYFMAETKISDRAGPPVKFSGNDYRVDVSSTKLIAIKQKIWPSSRKNNVIEGADGLFTASADRHDRPSPIISLQNVNTEKRMEATRITSFVKTVSLKLLLVFDLSIYVPIFGFLNTLFHIRKTKTVKISAYENNDNKIKMIK